MVGEGCDEDYNNISIKHKEEKLRETKGSA